MRFTEWTITVLKNFQTINTSMVLLPGKKQRTTSDNHDIMVEVELEDEFPHEFGILDLNQFLNSVHFLKDPELDFTEKVVTLKDGTFSIGFMACNKSLITLPPPLNKTLKIDNPIVEFDLSESVYKTVKRIADMNKLDRLSIIGNRGNLMLRAHEHNNDTSNHASTKLCDYSGADFEAIFKTENLKLIPRDYRVSIQAGAFAHFSCKMAALNYFIGLES